MAVQGIRTLGNELAEIPGPGGAFLLTVSSETQITSGNYSNL